MNSGSTAWASYYIKWSPGLKFEEADVGVFCGFIAINIPNIQFDVFGANALSLFFFFFSKL